MLPVSLSAAFHTTRLALPHMRRQNWGRIINIASVHGKVASPYKSAYVAAKHGMLGLTKVTALETADTPITANSICPGWVMTELVAAQVRSNAEAAGIPFEQAATELLSGSRTILAGIYLDRASQGIERPCCCGQEKQPTRVFSRPEDVGSLAVWLCSESAHTMRGAALSMDGGWSVP